MSKHIHILAICGTFMGGIAILARQLGYKVTGSDENIYPPMSNTLTAAGIEILDGFKAEHLLPRPDMVIVGNVCSRGNAAIEYMLNQNIPYTSGPAWLSENVLRDRHVLAVSGTHGKTTVTSMLTWILTFAGLKPGYLVGGVAHNLSETAELGQAPYFVIEADEYDTAFFDKRPKFLHYSPETLIINNIEFDHADIYHDLAAIKTQFHRLIKIVPGNGLILYPEQDSNVQDVLTKGVWSKTLCFSGPEAALIVKLNNADCSEFEVYDNGQFCGQIKWSQLGQHNVDNAMAAILAAKNIGIEVAKAVEALNSFRGVKRRLEFAGEVNGISIYDDFAHHPTAIEKTLSALRAKVGVKPIIAVLQFGSNTMKSGGHSDETIAAALNKANRVVILSPKACGLNIDKLCQIIAPPVQVYDNVDEIVVDFCQQLKTEDQVLIMSNKSFDGLQQKLVAALSN